MTAVIGLVVGLVVACFGLIIWLVSM